MAADRFSLLALRRRSVALWLVAIGSFSLGISYVVPVAATLAAAPDTITPLRELNTPSLAFPVLRAPSVTRHPSTPPPLVRVSQPTGYAPAASSPASSYAPASTTVPVVTNAYTIRPAPPQPKPEADLPVYEDSVGTIPTMPSMPEVSTPVTASTATESTAAATTTETTAPATDESTSTTSTGYEDGWMRAKAGGGS